MSGNRRKHIGWMLHTVMSTRGIRTATELKRRLNKAGVEISSSQLSRLVAAPPTRLSFEVLDGLVEVLDCEVSDLIPRTEPEENGSLPPKTAAPPKRPRGKTPRKRVVPPPEGTEPADLAGPNVHPFPIPRKK